MEGKQNLESLEAKLNLALLLISVSTSYTVVKKNTVSSEEKIIIEILTGSDSLNKNVNILHKM